MNKIFLILLVISCNLLAAPKPASESSFIGQWRNARPDVGQVTVDFQKNGRFVSKLELEEGKTSNAQGTWKIQNNKIFYVYEESLPEIKAGTKDEDKILEITDSYFVVQNLAGEKVKYTKLDAKGKEISTDEKLIRPLKLLSPAELEKLLDMRLKGGMEGKMNQFANMFFVESRIELGTCITLSGETKEIGATELQPVFPSSYQPTLREFLDVIALQTSSTWSYRKEKQQYSTTDKAGKMSESVAVISFDPVKRSKPYEVKLAEGWKAEDRGHWMAYIPKEVPFGMDIYELGTYSTDKKDADAALFTDIRQAQSLEWAQRVKKSVKAEDLKPAKVGDFDALFYEAMVPSQLGADVHWRQWIFMVGNKCYFIVSTIMPDEEKAIFPAVEAMVKSFKVRTATTEKVPKPAKWLKSSADHR